MSSFRIDTFPHQLPNPLERLNVYDGLIMNAELWEVSQAYLRQRQNVLFQATNQSGIVCGLGVKVIPPPTWSRARTRAQDSQRNEQRWLEIQPGLAVDAAGNPIVVGRGDERDRTFRIATPPPTSGVLTVYIVIQYVEPLPNDNQPAKLVEQCRFEERTDPPEGLDVELCRIQLTPGLVQLRMPQDIFSPAPGELDLRHRQWVQAKPLGRIRLGFMGPCPRTVYDNFESLNHALQRLTPELRVELISADVQLRETHPVEAVDVLYVAAQEFQPLLLRHRRWLEQFVQWGGTILLETPSKATPNFSPQVQQIFRTLSPWQGLRADHPLKTDPFLFTQPPTIGNQSISITMADGLIWISGELSSAWGIHRVLPRSDIRTAHELGANLLRYLWQRRSLTDLLHWQVAHP